MRLLICAGGTGGGVNPALAILQAVKDKTDVLWVGGEGGMEAALVQRASIPFQSIPAAGVHGVSLRKLPGNLQRLAHGFSAARRIVRDFRPDALLFTGGYLAVPMALAGRRVPSLLFVPDIEPGLAIKAIRPFVDQIAVSTEDSRVFFRSKQVAVTGYPTRAELAGWKRNTGRKKLGLANVDRVVLVLGGSRGARSINKAVFDVLPALLETTRILHVTGEADWPSVENMRRSLRSKLAQRYSVYAYLHEEMGAALAAADVVVSRAGASTLGEYPLFSLPAVLIPYPYAWRYQRVNAEYLTSRGAAISIDDSKLAEDLLPTLTALMKDPDRLLAMQEAMQRLAQPQAASKIAEILVALARKR